MVRGWTVLLFCQLVGSIMRDATGLPIPGSVLGLAMLLGYLVWVGGPEPNVRAAAQGLLRYFGLLFVPVAVGLVTELQELRQNALAIMIAIPVSTVLGLLVTGMLMNWFLTRPNGPKDA